MFMASMVRIYISVFYGLSEIKQVFLKTKRTPFEALQVQGYVPRSQNQIELVSWKQQYMM